MGSLSSWLVHSIKKLRWANGVPSAWIFIHNYLLIHFVCGMMFHSILQQPELIRGGGAFVCFWPPGGWGQLSGRLQLLPIFTEWDTALILFITFKWAIGSAWINDGNFIYSESAAVFCLSFHVTASSMHKLHESFLWEKRNKKRLGCRKMSLHQCHLDPATEFIDFPVLLDAPLRTKLSQTAKD